MLLSACWEDCAAESCCRCFHLVRPLRVLPAPPPSCLFVVQGRLKGVFQHHSRVGLFYLFRFARPARLGSGVRKSEPAHANPERVGPSPARPRPAKNRSGPVRPNPNVFGCPEQHKKPTGRPGPGEPARPTLLPPKGTWDHRPGVGVPRWVQQNPLSGFEANWCQLTQIKLSVF